MRYFVFLICAAAVTSGCSMSVTSPTAEKVALYDDQDAVPTNCEELGEVTARVCANTTPCPVEVMRRDMREQAYLVYGADAVWLVNTTLSGTEVVGHGIAYVCK